MYLPKNMRIENLVQVSNRDGRPGTHQSRSEGDKTGDENGRITD